MSASSVTKRSQRVGSVHLGFESAFLLFWLDMNSHDLTKSCLKVPDLPVPTRRQLTVHVSVGAVAVFYQHVNKNFLLAGSQVQHGLLAKNTSLCYHADEKHTSTGRFTAGSDTGATNQSMVGFATVWGKFFISACNDILR